MFISWFLQGMKSKVVSQMVNLWWKNNFAHLLQFYPSFFLQNIYEYKDAKGARRKLEMFTNQIKKRIMVLWMKDVLTMLRIWQDIWWGCYQGFRSKELSSAISSFTLLPYGNLFLFLLPLPIIDLGATKPSWKNFFVSYPTHDCLEWLPVF